jgi:hypothetical protein
MATLAAESTTGRRLLFEQRRGNAYISGAMALLGGLLTLYGSYYLATTYADQDNGIDAGAVLLIPGGLMLLFGLWAFVNRVRLYEQGVEQRSFFGTCFLEYDRIETLGYAATRILISGIEAGTRIWVTLRPERGRGIVFDLTVRGRSEPFERMRDQVANRIGARMAARVQQGESVAWTSFAKLTPEGLRYRPSRLIGRGAELLFPYSRALHWQFANGTLSIFDGAAEKAFLSLECRGPNFYPGFEAINLLIEAARR